MKYSNDFIKKNKKFPKEDVQRVLEMTDAHYPTMSKLVGFYNVCGHKLPPPKENVFAKEMRDAQITIEMIRIASEYFKYAKKRDKAALKRYLKMKEDLYAITR